MSNYKKHAEREFFLAGWTDENGKFEDDMQKMMCEQVLELLDVFAGSGHSGSSAPYAIQLFSSMAKFKLISPLTGNDDEWMECGYGVYQNKRLSSVFKNADDDRAYDIDGRVHWEWCKDDQGKVYKMHFGKGGDRFYIEFPYTQQDPVEVFEPTDEFPNEVLEIEGK